MDREVDIYTTIHGDMWDSISYKVYGKDKYSMELIKANPAYANVVVFSSSVELICPELTLEETSILPPWRR